MADSNKLEQKAAASAENDSSDEDIEDACHNLPKLAESDLEIWTDYLGDYVNMWLRNGPKFFEDQKYKMVRLALLPLLFGVGDNLPLAWIKIFMNLDDLKQERINKQDFTELEFDSLEMAEVLFKRCADLTVENAKDLKEILNFIYDVEERPVAQIDINYALEKLLRLKVFPSIWNPIRRVYEKKKRQAHLYILYFFKTIHQQVVTYGKDGQDKFELVKATIAERARKRKKHIHGRKEDDSGKFGLEGIKTKEWRIAEYFFTKALPFDPFNIQFYSGRAEALVNMDKFMQALPDCWRSIILNQKHSSKSCYHAAICYSELGNLEKAIQMNDLAMEFCVDADLRSLIKAQASDIEKAKQVLKTSRYRGSSESDFDRLEEEKKSVVFRKAQCDGSSLYQARRFSEAADKFHEALEMVAASGAKALETQEQDVLLLNYCYGLACVHTGVFSNLQNAIEKFHHVIAQSEDFPAAHYGLGLAYKGLNRFPEALKEFQTAMEKRKSSRGQQWPQTLLPLEETDPQLLQNVLKNLLGECRHPPRPDALCRFHADVENPRREIYRCDPDYKGFIRLLCSCKCCIEFHSNCWKTYRHNRNKHTDKEMLDKECPTPNCWGFIITLHIFKPDSDDPRVLMSSRKVEAKTNIFKPAVKMKTNNPLKIQRKADKKQNRRDRREEDRKKKEAEKLLEEEGVSSTPQTETSHYGDNDNDLRNLDANQKCMVLMSKEPDAMESKTKQKAAKPKKKKEKTKQVLTFDLQFSADKDKELLGADSVDPEIDYSSQPGLMGSPPVLGLFHLPSTSSLLPTPSVAATPPLGNGLLPLPLRPQPSVDVFLQNLVECFMTILQGGPVDLDSCIVRDVLGSAPSETRSRVAAAGGIAAFLSSQPQFVMAAGRVGLAKGGPGILSNGGGAGLLETPSLPVSNMGAGVGSAAPWGLGAAAQKNNQKGLLGSGPVQPSASSMSERMTLPQAGSLNPSAEEFVPGLRKNGEVKNSGEMADTVEDEEEEDEGGEFVTVTHKKSSHSKPLKGNHGLRAVAAQNGISNNLYSVLGEENSSKAEESSTKSRYPGGLGDPSSAMPPPPLTPLSMMSGGPAPPDRRRRVSDASSNISEEMRAASPGSSTSLGSSNSNPTSSSTGQGAVCPPQPLKASGLNLPKRSKRRDLREKIATRSGIQPAPTKSSLVDGKMPDAPAELDDLDSVGSSASDKDSASGMDTASLAPGAGRKASLPSTRQQKSMSSINDIDEESNLFTDTIDAGGLWNGAPYSSSENTVSELFGEKSMVVQDAAEAPKIDPFFPGMYDYGSSLEPSSYLKHSGRGSESMGNSSSLQTKVDQRLTESRVLRNLGLSSHSPSPPLTSDTSLNRPSPTATDAWNAGHMFDSSGNFRSAMGSTEDVEPVASTKIFGLDEIAPSGSQRFTPETLIKPIGYPGLKASTKGNPQSKFGFEDSLKSSTMNCGEDPYFPDYSYPHHSSASREAPKVSSSEFLQASSSLFSAPVASLERTTWSPLSSDTLQAMSHGQTSSPYQSWPRSFAQEGGIDDHEENPTSSTLFKEKSHQASTKADYGLSELSGMLSSSSSSSAAAAQKPKPTATASVNTELTGEKLKTLQQKFYDVKEERDALKVKVKAEQQEKEAEKTHREDLERRLSEDKDVREEQQKALEETRRRNRALEEERDSLSQALKEVVEKAQQLDVVKVHLKREAMKVKSHEKQILNLHRQAALSNLEMRRKEAYAHVYKIDGIIQRIRGAEQVEDPALTAKHREWETYGKACEIAMEEILETCRSHLQALEEGQSLEDMLPLKAPALPPHPKPPSEPVENKSWRQSLIGQPRPQVKETESRATDSWPEAEDDESAFLKMVFQGSGTPKQEKKNPAPAAVEPPPPLRLPPGLPRRPLSQGPVPLQLRTSPVSSSSSSSSMTTLGSVKLPSGQHATKSSLVSIAATVAPQSSFPQAQPPGLTRPAQAQQMSTFERLVQTIQETFPDQSRSQIQRIIEDLRRENGGSLASFSFDTLARCIAERIVDGAGESPPKNRPHQLHRVEGGQSQRGARPGSPSETTCTICHEDTAPNYGTSPVRRLDCGHRFHEDCIQSWLRVNQTCPNCRSHSLLEEDFPSLRKF